MINNAICGISFAIGFYFFVCAMVKTVHAIVSDMSSNATAQLMIASAAFGVFVAFI